MAFEVEHYTDQLIEALEKAQQVDEELCKLLPPGAEYMDPPDGGDVTPLEGVRRMVADYRQRIAELESQLKAAENNEIDARCHIADLESRTVKLPKPHAHLIWIQAGHAPDDYWDDVAVSHSEKDLCCDGSERYPVYARWEIEEMFAAAGIKVEAEMKIRIVLQELKEDGVLTTYSNGHVEMLPYRIDENGDEYVEMFPNDIEQH